MKDCEKYTQVKYSNMNYVHQMHMLHPIFKIYSGGQNIVDTGYAGKISLAVRKNKTNGKK